MLTLILIKWLPLSEIFLIRNYCKAQIEHSSHWQSINDKARNKSKYSIFFFFLRNAKPSVVSASVYLFITHMWAFFFFF